MEPIWALGCAATDAIIMRLIRGVRSGLKGLEFFRILSDRAHAFILWKSV